MALRRPTPTSGEAARVLLVEADARKAALVTEMLRTSWREPLVFAHVEGLAEATQELLDRGAGCILLALDSSEGDGVARVQQLHAAVPDIALVGLVDEPDERLGVDAVASGAQDCVVRSTLYPDLLRRVVAHAIVRKRAEVRRVRQALHDPLTGLPNRALFLDRLSVALDRSRRTKSSIVVLFVDVDNFKEINDSMGHAAGDQLLAGLADRLRAMLRPMDTVARFGGDEFTLLFEDIASEREAVLIAERIRYAAGAPMRILERQIDVSASIGIAIVSDPTTPPETVIREADAAMYRAKEHGRSRYELYDEISRQRASDRLELESELRGALDRSELRVHYQPKVSLNGRTGLVGFEALVRWQHPRRGLLGPSDFMPLAEETGMMSSIGAFVLDEAVHKIVAWRRRAPEMTISVNLSAGQLLDPSLVSVLTAALQSTELPAEALCLEVREQALADNADVAVRVLHGLSSLGVQVAIDDYGTGSSVLSTLGRLPVNVLKIHESLVRDLGSESAESAVAGAVIDLGHALGLRVVAEGVETDAQLERLRSLGCDGAQGYLFSPAVPEDQASALLGAE